MSSVYENSCIKLHSGVCLLTSFEGVVYTNVVTFISEECILSEVQIYQCWVREAFTSVCNTYAEYFSTVSDLTSHKMNDGILI